MFFHNLKYLLLSSLRVKEYIFWLLVFPIALGLFFKMAFSGIYEKQDTFNPPSAAIVASEDNEILRNVIGQIESSEKPVFKAGWYSEEEAEKKLKDEDVHGVIRSEGGVLKLAVAGEGMYQTILKSFCDRYNSNAAILTQTADFDPSKLAAVSEILTKDIRPVENIQLTDGNTNYYTEYFYNLIAMVALFGSLAGMTVTIENQANLSALGARKCCSPTPKSINLAASLVSRFILQSVCMTVCVTFQKFVLGIDFGKHLGLVYLAAIFAGILGVSLGFAVGSIGRGSKDLKNSINTAAIMLSCFLSGLMVGNMKSLIGRYAPFVNEINPASVISDCFHCLNIYDNYDRFISKLIVMAVMTLVFAFIGFILTRRRKYASL